MRRRERTRRTHARKTQCEKLGILQSLCLGLPPGLQIGDAQAAEATPPPQFHWNLEELENCLKLEELETQLVDDGQMGLESEGAGKGGALGSTGSEPQGCMEENPPLSPQMDGIRFVHDQEEIMEAGENEGTGTEGSFSAVDTEDFIYERKYSQLVDDITDIGKGAQSSEGDNIQTNRPSKCANPIDTLALAERNYQTVPPSELDARILEFAMTHIEKYGEPADIDIFQLLAETDNGWTTIEISIAIQLLLLKGVLCHVEKNGSLLVFPSTENGLSQAPEVRGEIIDGVYEVLAPGKEITIASILSNMEIFCDEKEVRDAISLWAELGIVHKNGDRYCMILP